MTETELLNLIKSSDAAIAAGIAQTISLSFAVVVATFYFLHRSGVLMRLFAFTLYAGGFLAFVGMALRDTNLKRLALEALRDRTDLSRVGAGYLQLQDSWLFRDTSILLNAVLWLQVLGVVFFLFFWRKPRGDA